MRQDVPQADICVVYAGPERAKAGSSFGPVIRSVYIVECCTGGKGTVQVNGRIFAVRAGDCYVLLPGDTVAHTSDGEQPREGCWCALDGPGVEACLEQAGISAEQPFLPKEVFGLVRDWMRRLTEEWACQDAGAGLRQTACAYGLLGAMLQGLPAPEKSTLIDRAVGLMQTRYPEPLQVADLAAHVGLERTYFSQLFKQKTGLSPYRYLTRLRIQRACALLQQGYSAMETADLVGLEPHNFGRVFKREVGSSPRGYLQSLRQSESRLASRQVQVKE